MLKKYKKVITILLVFAAIIALVGALTSGVETPELNKKIKVPGTEIELSVADWQMHERGNFVTIEDNISDKESEKFIIAIGSVDGGDVQSSVYPLKELPEKLKNHYKNSTLINQTLNSDDMKITSTKIKKINDVEYCVAKGTYESLRVTLSDKKTKHNFVGYYTYTKDAKNNDLEKPYYVIVSAPDDIEKSKAKCDAIAKEIIKGIEKK